MLEFMQKLRKVVTVGIVGGSDLVKIQEQLGESCITDYDYVFAENGLVAHKSGDLLAIQSLKKHLGEDSLKVWVGVGVCVCCMISILKCALFVQRQTSMPMFLGGSSNNNNNNSSGDLPKNSTFSTTP